MQLSFNQNFIHNNNSNNNDNNSSNNDNNSSSNNNDNINNDKTILFLFLSWFLVSLNIVLASINLTFLTNWETKYLCCNKAKLNWKSSVESRMDESSFGQSLPRCMHSSLDQKVNSWKSLRGGGWKKNFSVFF